MFDFTVFGFFAVMIGDRFFPASDPMTSLLWAVGTFGVGFFMRPVGAMVIGAYADRVGRRAAMVRTSWMMALGTAALGLCPPCQHRRDCAAHRDRRSIVAGLCRRR